jgi:hypothetical protein
MNERNSVLTALIAAFAACVVAATLFRCTPMLKVDNPVSLEYPCGTRGIVCDTSPVSCCWRGEACGKEGSSCPEGMCCYDGEGFGASEPRRQWVAQ